MRTPVLLLAVLAAGLGLATWLLRAGSPAAAPTARASELAAGGARLQESDLRLPRRSAVATSREARASESEARLEGGGEERQAPEAPTQVRLLLVRDRDTGAHLDGVSVSLVSGLEDPRPLGAGRSSPLELSLPSPLEVGVLEVTASGYEARSVRLNAGGRDPVPVDLSRSGRLEVVVEGAERWRESWLHVRRAEDRGRPTLRRAVRGASEHSFAAVPAGALDVSLTRHSNSFSGDVLDRREVFLPPGGVMTVRLVAPAPLQQPPSFLVGRVHASKHHFREHSARVRITPRRDEAADTRQSRTDTMRLSAEEDERLVGEFVFRGLPAGEYDLSVDDLWTEELSVPAGGLEGHAVRIPDQSRVTVTVVDPVGAPVQDADAFAYRILPSGRVTPPIRPSNPLPIPRDPGAATAAPNPAAYVTTLALPRGRYHVGATDGHDTRRGGLDVEVFAADQGVQVTLEPTTRLRVRVGGDAHALHQLGSHALGQTPSLVDDEGAWASRGWHLRDDTWTTTAPRPGRFTLRLPYADGFLPPEPLTLEFEAGKQHEVVAEYRRR